MNAEVFKTWFIRFLYTLHKSQLKNTAIANNNARYHFLLLSTAPTTSSRKHKIIKRQQETGVCHDQNRTTNHCAYGQTNQELDETASSREHGNLSPIIDVQLKKVDLSLCLIN
jgi:hypothetical protein